MEKNVNPKQFTNESLFWYHGPRPILQWVTEYMHNELFMKRLLLADLEWKHVKSRKLLLAGV